MNRFFADLHIHLGRTFEGKPVKISASSNLTLPNVLHTAFLVKGMQMIGIIDCHVPAVIEELEQMIRLGELYEHDEGGLIYDKGCLILGSEIEIYDESCKGPIHVLVFFPDLQRMKTFSSWLASRMTNPNLSSQRFYGTGRELQEKTKQLNGLFIIAHAFTPFKSMYGKGVEKSLTEVFNPDEIDGIELGLSCDSEMADPIEELRRYPFLTNSDAHSPEKIAREYQVIEMERPTFKELERALKSEDDLKIFQNYGLNPLLGKYYRTCCPKCGAQHSTDHVGKTCTQCGKGRVIKGVYDRINEISRDGTERIEQVRPEYTHQVPLEFIPGIGPGTLRKLRNTFGTDMQVIHNASKNELLNVIPEKTAMQILQSREGKLDVNPGGGGKYGSIRKS